MLTVSNNHLPPTAWKPKGKPCAPSWKKTREQAAARGLTDRDIVPGRLRK